MKSLDLFKGGLPQAGNLRYTVRENRLSGNIVERLVKLNEDETFKMLNAGPRMTLTLHYYSQEEVVKAQVELEYSESINAIDQKILQQAASLFRRILEQTENLSLLIFGDNFLSEADRMTSPTLEKRYLW